MRFWIKHFDFAKNFGPKWSQINVGRKTFVLSSTMWCYQDHSRGKGNHHPSDFRPHPCTPEKKTKTKKKITIKYVIN